MAPIKFEQVENKIITLRDMQVLIDSDVAELYGVETKRINEAVSNNPDKFPDGYIVYLDENELNYLRSKFSTTKLSMTRTPPKAFTEKGLYMLATILKSPQATATTIAIVETFAKMRELTRTLAAMQETEDEPKQKSLIQKSGEIIADLLDDGLSINASETTVELNLAMFKIKHTVKRK